MGLGKPHLKGIITTEILIERRGNRYILIHALLVWTESNREDMVSIETRVWLWVSRKSLCCGDSNVSSGILYVELVILCYPFVNMFK